MEEIKQLILNYFGGLTFEEKAHKYTVKDTPIKMSVSGIIDRFVEPFDVQGISLGVANKTGKTQKQIIKEWDDIRDESCTRGTRVHLFGEKYSEDRTLKPSCGQEQAIVNFWNDLPSHIVQVTPELQMYHKDYLFAGTADVPLYNTVTGKFIIGDYKTNKDLFKNFRGKKMLGIFSDLLDCPLSHYEVQLALYQILFEQTTFEVERRRIIHLLPDGSYKLYDTRDLKDRLLDYLKNNSVC